MTKALEDPTPLKPDYLPQKFVDREDEKELLSDTFSSITESPRNLFIHGPRGTGKTHLLLKQLNQLPDSITTCYVPGTRYDTQYKALKHVYTAATGQNIETGHHSADLKRSIEERIQAHSTVIVLDEIDFLLMNDGDDLLYYLSRLPGDLSIITISANNADLETRLEERTYSSLHPRRLAFDPYTTDELFEILAARARNALVSQSLNRRALRYIASTVSNPRVGLHWLQIAGETTNDAITDTLVKQVQSQASQRYADTQLEAFTDHHRLVYQVIQELTIAQEVSIRTGQIYSRYQHLCKRFENEPLSRRRISDFLKHLELLDLIDVNYHYGGKHGRTREIRLKSFSKR